MRGLRVALFFLGRVVVEWVERMRNRGMPKLMKHWIKIIAILGVLLVPNFTYAAEALVVPKIISADYTAKLSRDGGMIVMEQIRFNPGSVPQSHLTRVLRKSLDGGKQELSFSNIALIDEERKAIPFQVTDESDRVIVSFGEKDTNVEKEVLYVLTYSVSGAAIVDGDAWTVRALFLDDQFGYSVPKVNATVVLPRELPNREFQFWCSKLVQSEASECSSRQFRSKDQLLSDAVMGTVVQMPEKSEMLMQLKLPKTYLQETTETIKFFSYVEKYWMYGVLGIVVIGFLVAALRSKDEVVEEKEESTS